MVLSGGGDKPVSGAAHWAGHGLSASGAHVARSPMIQFAEQSSRMSWGLCVDPRPAVRPQHRRESQIQALDPQPARSADEEEGALRPRWTHDYKRNGTENMFAARHLEGKVISAGCAEPRLRNSFRFLNVVAREGGAGRKAVPRRARQLLILTTSQLTAWRAASTHLPLQKRAPDFCPGKCGEGPVRQDHPTPAQTTAS